MANIGVLFRNHHAHYSPLVRDARREFGIDNAFQNGGVHALTAADLSNQVGSNITLGLGEALEWRQYLFGRQSALRKGHTEAAQENYKDSTANLIGAYTNKYLSDTYGDVGVKTRAQAIAILARDGLIPKDFNHAVRLRSLDLPRHIAASLDQADFQSGQIGISPAAQRIWDSLKIGPRQPAETDEEWHIRPQSP